MTPKSLLRHKEAVSTLADFGPGSSFRRILVEADNLVDGAQVRRVLLCSGKVYFDLVAEPRDRERIELLDAQDGAPDRRCAPFERALLPVQRKLA
jgi:2-oxoglutarate dehydrogenase complex dehydrogenase (E1) component-like enzyme